MSSKSIKEYILFLRQRYQISALPIKKMILDELCRNLGIHRKSAIRIMRAPSKTYHARSGRKKRYTPECVPHLKKLWLLMDQPHARKMAVDLPKWIDFYKGDGFSPEIQSKLLSMSPSTINRLLKSSRSQMRQKHFTGTMPHRWYKNIVPIKPFDWNVTEPGHTEADTVSHCGGSATGEYVWTLTVTDVLTTWTELEATWHKRGDEIEKAFYKIEERIPFCFFSVSVDNGSEFLNERVLAYFKGQNPDLKRKLTKVIRSRPDKKNDQCHVEQKNHTHVRELFGYERYDQKILVDLMNDVYRNEWRLLKNFFSSSMKLLRKTRVGSKYKRIYTKLETPYERILASDKIDSETKEKLKAQFKSLNPIELKKSLETKLRKIEEIRKGAWVKDAG